MKICKLRYRWAAKKEQIPQWLSHVLWDTVLRTEVADNDSSVRGQWYLKNFTLELSPVSTMLQIIYKIDMFYITDGK